MLIYANSRAFHGIPYLIDWFLRSHVDRDSLVLEGFLEEGEDQLAFRMNVGVEQNGVIVGS